MSVEIWTYERGKTDVCNMSVDNLPFWLVRGLKVGDFPRSFLWGAARQRLDADDVGQRQVVGVGGNVVDALFVKGDADDLACG